MQPCELYNGQRKSNEGHAFAAKIIGSHESWPLVPKRLYHMTNERSRSPFSWSQRLIFIVFTSIKRSLCQDRSAMH